MSSAALLAKIKSEVEPTPVSAAPNVQILHPRSSEEGAGAKQLDEADWDKFEADIEAAFEQLP